MKKFPKVLSLVLAVSMVLAMVSTAGAESALSYADGTESTGRVNVLKDISQSIVGKDLLIVEDIIDSGNTLSFLVKYFMAKGANSVKMVTLFDKPDRRVKEVPVAYIGKRTACSVKLIDYGGGLGIFGVIGIEGLTIRLDDIA